MAKSSALALDASTLASLLVSYLRAVCAFQRLGAPGPEEEWMAHTLDRTPSQRDPAGQDACQAPVSDEQQRRILSRSLVSTTRIPRAATR
jgi:hypothetical protein